VTRRLQAVSSQHRRAFEPSCQSQVIVDRWQLSKWYLTKQRELVIMKKLFVLMIIGFVFVIGPTAVYAGE
jgi:hypothetical protein